MLILDLIVILVELWLFPDLLVLAMMIVDIIGESKLNNIFLRQLEQSG